MAMNVSFLIRTAWIAHDEVRRTLGRVSTLSVLLEVGRRNALGHPFRHAPPPSDEQEAATRNELAPAINLYHVLRDRLGESRAFDVARRVILNSSLLHLRSIYPDFPRDSFTALVAGGRDEASRRLATDFAFADTEVLEISDTRAAFDVVACRIPGVLEFAGAERLAPIFCEVDELYFLIYEPHVRLERAGTIVGGSERCPFRLTWRDG